MEKTQRPSSFQRGPSAASSASEELYESEFDNGPYSANSNLAPQDPAEKTRLEEEWKAELAKLEEEIITLRTVLSTKVNQSTELKRKLGITPVAEFKQDVKQGFQNIKESDAYQQSTAQLSQLVQKIGNSTAVVKTNEKLHQIGDSIANTGAYQKTSAALKTFGAYTSKKMGDLKNSQSFRSFQEKVGDTYTNVKTRVSGSRSENNFDEATNSDEKLSEEKPPR